MLEESVSSAPTFWAGLNSWFTPTVFFVVLQLVIGTIYITSTLNNHKHRQEQQQQQQQQDPQVPDFQHPQLVRSPSVLQRLRSINFYSNSYPYRSQDPDFHQTHEQQQPQLPRSPSLLQRLKSINLYSYLPTEPFTSKLTTNDTVSNTTTHHEITYEHEKQQHVYDTAVVETDEENEDDDDVVGKIQNNLKQHEEGFGGAVSSSMDEIYSKLQGQGQDGHFERTKSDTKPASGEIPVKLSRKMKKSASSKSSFSHFKEDDIVESRRPATVREKKVSAAADDDDEVDAKADDFINKFKQQLKLQRLDSILNYKEMIGRGS